MHRKELFMLGNMGRLEENVITVVKKRGTTVFIIITIIFLSSSVLVNCLYLNSQYLPFLFFHPVLFLTPLRVSSQQTAV